MFNRKYISFLEKEIEEKKEEIKRKDEEIFRLQAALVAKEAPYAYEHFEKKQPPENEEAKKRLQAERKILQEYSQRVEGPLFRDADEMFDSLALVIGPPKSESVHGNSES